MHAVYGNTSNKAMFLALVLHLFFLMQNIYADQGVNFALTKKTWQSSTEADGVSSRAVDGFKNPFYPQNSCIKTRMQYEPWWTVDLEQNIFVTSVQITNRADCCWENLKNFDVRIGASLTDDGKRNPRCGATYSDVVGAGQTVSVNCVPPLLGRFVTVSITNTEETLNFCEVEVFGYQQHNVFHVKAVSYGAKEDADVDNSSFSQLTVDDMYNETFTKWGHYVISFDIRTGHKIDQKHFDTYNDSSAVNEMPLYLQNLPSEIFVFIISNGAGWTFYQTSIPILQTLSGVSHISDQLTWGDAWSLLGYKGILPSPSWRNSVITNVGYSPAVIEDIIPKLLVPPAPPSSSITIADLTSSSITIIWSRPPGIVTENELPLNYTVCVVTDNRMMFPANGTDYKCKSVGNTTLFTATDLKPETKYIVGVRAQSYAGAGPEAVVHVTTMKNDSRKIYVELLSRIEPDILYRLDARPYSSIAVKGQLHTFNQHGLHFVVLDPKTGTNVKQGSFNTHQNSSASSEMAQFLSTIPKPSIILLVVFYQAHDYYTASSLLSVCPIALSNYTSLESWSMICLYGYGTMPWVTSLTSNGGDGPAVIKTHILLPKELENVPNSISAIATSSQALQVQWTAPTTDNQTGDISYYQICYQQSNSPITSNCSLISVSGNLAQAEIGGLHPYEEYRVKIRGVVALGYGPYSNDFLSTTHEAEPSSGPTNITFPRRNSTSILVTWSPPPKEDRNGVIQQYSVCYNLVNDTNPCENETVTDNLWFEATGLRPYRFIQFTIKAGTTVGFGPANVGYQWTLQTAPSRGPANIKFPRRNSTSILMTWSLPPKEDRNGIILQYSLCYKLEKDKNPCMPYTITNNTWFEINGLRPHQFFKFAIKAGTAVGFGPPRIAYQWTTQAAPDGPPIKAQTTDVQPTNISLSWEPPVPELRNGGILRYSICLLVFDIPSETCQRGLGARRPKLIVTNLKPYTKYIFNISAHTKVGFGPPASVIERTLQTAPSGPPADILVSNFTHNEINITWSPPHPAERNGVITEYSLCIARHGQCLTKDTVNFNQTSYTFNNLRPYRPYKIHIEAATMIGFGPSGIITQQTAESEPDGPPLRERVNYIDESTIDFSWEPPSTGLRNGIILHYNVCIREYGPDFSCKRPTTQLPHERRYVYRDLKPSSEYVVVIKTATIVGLGPPAFIQKTVGECDIPVLRANGHVNKFDFTASGFLGREYGPNQLPIDDDFHWCDSGLNDAYLQIDLAGPLRVTGVATTRHAKYWESWVSSYEVVHSLDGFEWNHVNVGGKTLIDGNAGTIRGKKVTHFIDEPVFARFIRFQVRTFVGFHPCMTVQIFGCAPVLMPNTTSVLHKTAFSIQISWTPLPSQVFNGRIYGYEICHKSDESSEPCEITAYVGHDTTSYTVKDLVPFTGYEFAISAGTAAGYGPSVLLTATTNESIPSGPPLRLMAQNTTATSLKLVWLPPEYNRTNGIIMYYGICYQEARLGTNCTTIVIIRQEQMSFEITKGLRPYTQYVLVVMAATKIVGWGPQAMINETTLTAAPSGPPTSVYVVRIGSNILQVFWEPPEPKKQNGAIVGYRLCIKEKRFSHPCRSYVHLPESQMNMYSFDDLKPFTVYNIQVQANTSVGYGPEQYLDYRTGEAAPTAPPKDIVFKSVTTTSIEITWTPPEPEKRNGIIVMYEVEVFQEIFVSKVEKITNSLMRNTTIWKIYDLRPRTDYIFHVRAGTAQGFGPAAIVHKRSGGRYLQTDKSTHKSKGKLTTESIAGGTILLVALIVAFVFSMLWNKGMLPRTRTRKLRLELQKEEGRCERRRKSSVECSEPGTDTYSVYSELDDYDTPTGRRQSVKQQRNEDEVWYDADGVKVYSSRTMPPHGDAPSGVDIYGNTPPRIDIYEAADPGGSINAAQKSNTILPPIVQKSAALPYISPMESALSSVFLKLSSPALDDAKNSKKKARSSRGKKLRHRSPIPSSFRSSPLPPERKVKKNTWGAKSSKIAPLKKEKIPAVPLRSNTAGTDITPGSSFPSASMKSSRDHPIRKPSINSDPTTDKVIEFLYESSKAKDSGTDIAGSDLVPVSIFRQTTPQMSDVPTFAGNRRRSTNYHPNMPRYSIDFSASHGPNNLQKLPPLPAYPKLNSEPIIHQPSTSNLKKKK